MDANEALTAAIEKEMDAWAKQFIAQRLASLDRQKIKARGELAASLGYEIPEGFDADTATLLIAFNDYGRIAEMRRINHDKWGRNAITRVEDWVVKKGVERFVSGFLKKHNLKKVPKDILNRMAWGILISRAGGKFRRKQWWNKPKSAALNDLYNQVAVSLLDVSTTELTKAFK